MDVARLTALLRPHLELCGAPWALAGGLAVIAWGSPRTTTDVDLVVDESGRSALVPGIAAEGFEILNDVVGFTNLRHPDADLGRLDLLWLEGSTSRRMFSAAKTMTGADGRPILVLKPEHLVAMKIHAIRNRATRAIIDGPDLRFLLSLPGIDENECRDYFERAGLLDLHERLKGRF